MTDTRWHGASFRDPSGYVFTHDGELYRTVTEGFADHYDQMANSGLVGDLTERGWLVRHEEVDPRTVGMSDVYRVLKPERIPFISYPWEWCFSQLRDAALLTLDIAWAALEHDMVLKDASAFNVQFVGSRPVFIDTLSFQSYVEGEPWPAYRQFCQHFLAPLELRSRVHPALAKLSQVNLDGVPLDLASTLLPRRTLFSPSVALHIHAHSRAQEHYSDSGGEARKAKVSQRSLFALLDSLRSAVRRTRWAPVGTTWADYYSQNNYVDEAMSCKVDQVSSFLDRVAPASVWDLGANDGRFSRMASERGAYTVAFDMDPAAVEKAYRQGCASGDCRILPLVMDLMNPTPQLGWNLEERESFLERGSPDVVLALALVHHLAIAQNVPLPRIAEFFAGLSDRLVIEFVPKSDSQVQRMLASRTDIFSDYDQAGFERAFSRYFHVESAAPVSKCDRVLYFMRRNVA